MMKNMARVLNFVVEEKFLVHLPLIFLTGYITIYLSHMCANQCCLFAGICEVDEAIQIP